MVVENLETAYNYQDLDEYLLCFRDDFFFLTCPPDTFWGYDTEMLFHERMFSNVDDILLTLSGDAEWTWSGDSTGQSLELLRSFYMKVYYTSGSQNALALAEGQARFICRPDSSGDWYVWRWEDESEISDSLMTWTEIKAMF